MAEPQTVNGGLIVPNTGDLVGTWGSAALNPDFVAIDGFLCGVQTVSVSSSPVTLTSPSGFTPTPGGGPTQSQNAILRITGSLGSNVQITLPLPGYMIVENLTGASLSWCHCAPLGLEKSSSLSRDRFSTFTTTGQRKVRQPAFCRHIS